MKHRISRVTTRTGDTGFTSLADGTRLSKSDRRMEAIGTVDELNSFVGVLITHVPVDGRMFTLCQRLQQELFDLGACLATAGATPAPSPDAIEHDLTDLNATLPALTEFVLPGGAPAAAAAHVCRTVCRRAERTLWAVETEDTRPAARYLNRLSDLFFVIARCCNAGQEEAQWRGSRPPPEP